MRSLAIPCLLTCLAASARADDPPLANLHEVPFTQVKIDDAFCAPRRQTNRTVSLQHSLDILDKTGYLANFHLAAQKKQQGYHGRFLSYGDLYKTLCVV